MGKFHKGHEQPVRKHLEMLSVGAGPVEVIGLTDIVEALLGVSESRTSVNDPVAMTMKVLRHTGHLTPL